MRGNSVEARRMVASLVGAEAMPGLGSAHARGARALHEERQQHRRQPDWRRRHQRAPVGHALAHEIERPTSGVVENPDSTEANRK